MPACFASFRLGTRHPNPSPQSACPLHDRSPYLVSVGVLLVAIALGVTPPCGATSEPRPGLVLDPGQPTEQLAPLVASLVELRVQGMVARATVTQQFVHPGDRPVEALFVFPLPPNAAVDGLRLTVGDRVTEGQIQPLTEAQATFAEARQAGKTAVLLEQLRDDRFTARVTQLAPGDTVGVELSLGFEVRYDRGTFELRFPLASPDRHGARGALGMPEVPSSPTAPGADPVALRLDLEAGVPLARLDSPSHGLTIEAPTPSRRIVELAAEAVDADRDFVVEWTPRPAEAPRAAAYVETHDDAHFGLLMVLPPSLRAIRPIPREIHFVLDISGSMKGERLANARKALAQGIAGLNDADRFNIATFDDQVDFLWPATRPANATSQREARQHVRSLETRGGTDIPGALAAVLARPVTKDRLHQVVLITDGQIRDQVTTYQLLRRDLGDRRLFTVGMGSAPNTAFMRRVAELGRGTHTFIEHAGRIEERVAALLDKLATPAMVDLEILWDDPSAESFPHNLPDLYAGEPLLVAVRSQRPPAGRLLGWRDGQPWEQRFDLAGTQRALVENARGIDQRWARRKIDHLWLADQLGELDPDTTARQEITTLALRHHLVSAYTALVAVDPHARVEPGSAPIHRTVARSPVADSVPFTVGAQEENIIVTGELTSTLASSSVGTTFRFTELDPPPEDRFEARLDAVPGLLGQAAGDRQSPVNDRAVALPGTLPEATLWTLDTTPVEGPVPGRRSALPFFEEVEVGRGGSDIAMGSEGTHVVLTTRSGGNVLRVAVQAQGGGELASSSDLRATEGAQRLASTHHLAADAGTVLRQDSAWLWLGVAQRDDRRQVSGPDSPVEAGYRDENQAGTLDLGSDRTHTSLRFFRGEDTESGRWAGRDRTSEATLDARSLLQAGSLQTTWVSADLVFEGQASGSRLERGTEPTASTPALWDGTGILRGSWRHDSTEQTRNAVRLSASRLFDRTVWGSSQSHELDLGASATWLDDRMDRRGPSAGLGTRTLSIVGDAVGAASSNLAWIEPTGTTFADRTAEALWLQDTLYLPTLEITVGLRWDRWQGRLDEATPRTPARALVGTSEVDWQSLSPRLAATWRPHHGALTLRVGWSRFARRLDADTLWSASPTAFGRAFVAFDDLDGDQLLGAEPTTLLDAQGFTTGHRFAPGLDPEITDEVSVGIELTPSRPWRWRLLAVRRETRDLHELRRLVDAGDGPRLALRRDYTLDHTLTIALPDGSTVWAPVFSLNSGVTDLGSGLWVHSDRRRVYEGVTLEVEPRRRRWIWARGALHVGEHRGRPGGDFEQHVHRPPRLGGDNTLVLAGPSDPDLGDDWHGGRWTFRLEGGLTVADGQPWSFDLAAVVQGRDGNPQPWFVHDQASADGRLRRVALVPTDAPRHADPWTLDLHLAKTLELGQGPELDLDLTLRNLFDTDPVIRQELDLASPRAGQIEARLTGREVLLGARLVW